IQIVRVSISRRRAEQVGDIVSAVAGRHRNPETIPPRHQRQADIVIAGIEHDRKRAADRIHRLRRPGAQPAGRDEDDIGGIELQRRIERRERQIGEIAGDGGGRRAEAPSTKDQAPEKNQIPRSKSPTERPARVVGIWSLKLLWSLGLGAWSFCHRSIPNWSLYHSVLLVGGLGFHKW